MNTLLKYTGLIIELIGVALLIIPKLMETTSNVTLAAGGLCMIIGVIVHIILNRMIKD